MQRYARLKISAPVQFISPTLVDGTANPYWPLVTTLNDAIDSQDSRSNRHSDGVNVHWNGQLDLSFFNMQAIEVLIANGGEVLGFPSYFEITTLDDALPAPLQYNRQIDEEQTELVDTFAKWNLLGHTLYTVDNRNFLSTACNNAEYLPGSVIEQIKATVPIINAFMLPQNSSSTV